MDNVGYGLRKARVCALQQATSGMGMGGWVGLQKLITFLAKSLDIRGECINDGLELASSLCRSYEAKTLQMKQERILREYVSVLEKL